MKKIMKDKKFKIGVIAFIIIFVIVLCLLIFKSLFGGSGSDRYEGVKNHKLTNKEITAVTNKINELDKVKSVKVNKNGKIIKIMIDLEEDISFDSVKQKCNEALSGISKSNLEFYDVEAFVNSENKDSEIYPKIGSKHKSREEFAW